MNNTSKEKESPLDVFEVKHPTQLMKLSVIIAARDEVDFIGNLINKIGESLYGFNHEIIVVDDGSKDRTGPVAEMNGAVTLSRERSYGKGSAMKIGAEKASGDILVFIDGDGAHDPADIPYLIVPILEGKADLVIGSRDFKSSDNHTKLRLRRTCNILASFAISVVVSFVLPIVTFSKYPIKWTRIRDCTSGLRAIKKQNWQKLDIVSQGFQIETEMIYEAVQNNLVISETPIRCNGNNNNGSHLSIFFDGLRCMKLLASKLIGDIKSR